MATFNTENTTGGDEATITAYGYEQTNAAYGYEPTQLAKLPSMAGYAGKIWVDASLRDNIQEEREALASC